MSQNHDLKLTYEKVYMKQMLVVAIVVSKNDAISSQSTASLAIILQQFF